MRESRGGGYLDDVVTATAALYGFAGNLRQVGLEIGRPALRQRLRPGHLVAGDDDHPSNAYTDL
jgi:hypothetical protein